MRALLSRGKKVVEEIPAIDPEVEAYHRELEAKYDAMNRSQAVIEFEPDGTILTANENFLGAVGYTLQEIQGQHHRMFVEPAEAESVAYRQFWDRLRRGEFEAAEYMRVAKGGHSIWIQATYNPVFDCEGRVVKVVKFATDITAEKLHNAENKAQIASIHRSQAVIEFNLDGTIITANDNFLAAVGYSLNEIVGQHHRMFVHPDYAAGEEYKAFWRSLNSGEYQSAEYCRLAKGGREIWIQASYNPVFDGRGKVTKVIKFATDITAAKQAKQQTEEIGKSVANSVTEMAATIDEISRNVNRTASLASTTKDLASSTIDIVHSLDQCSQSIGEVVRVIEDLADQTQVLALNATIEAARAGNAGHSFAVVASEVKQLAQGTAEATKNIDTVVTEIKSQITRVVHSTGEINSSISEVSSNTNNVAAAIEEQSATTANLSDTATTLLALTESAP
ncbi:MAG: PAS domain-containing methyl-accepting chemotaxis protein [Planctomycetota bacterium]